LFESLHSHPQPPQIPLWFSSIFNCSHHTFCITDLLWLFHTVSLLYICRLLSKYNLQKKLTPEMDSTRKTIKRGSG
jgi:hypothetical protein